MIAYQESIQFEKLPQGKEDEILFGDCIINKISKTRFELKNTSNDTIRFAWDNVECMDFTFKPEFGHLRAGESKKIKVFFNSDKTQELKQVELKAHLPHI